MDVKHVLIAGAVAVASCATASAQEPPNVAPTPSASSYTSDESSHWLASGFVGSNFANNAQPASMNFGASVAYLWKNMYGAEFDTGFTPSFELQSNFFGTGVKPAVNSYMANAVWAKPFGDGRFQPFVSGGVGAITLRSGVVALNAPTTSSNDSRFGGDVGGGVMAFSGNWGIKADVRYLRATGTYNTGVPAGATQPGPTPSPSPGPGPYGLSTNGTGVGGTAVTPVGPVSMPPNAGTTSLAGAALAGLHFWRANVGVALRW